MFLLMKSSIPTEEKKKTLQNDNENDELNANEYYTRDYWKVHDHHLGKLISSNLKKQQLEYNEIQHAKQPEHPLSGPETASII